MTAVGPADLTTTKGPTKRRTYTYEDRLGAIRLHEEGLSSTEIESRTGIDSSIIRRWVRRYEAEGNDGLRRKNAPAIVDATINNGNPKIFGTAGTSESSGTTELPGTSESTGTAGSAALRGYVRSIDNPGVVRALVERLTEYGVPVESITVGDDSLGYLRSLRFGSRVVVNSLFDLSSDISEIMRILGEAFAQQIGIVSLGDGGITLSPDTTSTGELLKLLGAYASMSGQTSPRLVVSSGERRGRPSNAISPGRVETYMNAVRLFNAGHSMSSAAKAAGCKYSSFRYWYLNYYTQRV